MAWQQHIMQPHHLQKNAPVGVLNPYLINDPGYLEYQQEKQRLKDKKAEELKKLSSLPFLQIKQNFKIENLFCSALFFAIRNNVLKWKKQKF